RAAKLVRRRARRVAAVVGTSVVVASLGVAYLLTRGARSGPAPGIHSLLVLPLETLSADPDQDYLANGLTEGLTTELAKIGSLRVISHVTALQAKRERKPLGELGRELGIDAVVEGSIARMGNRIRLTAQLIQLNPEAHLW